MKEEQKIKNYKNCKPIPCKIILVGDSGVGKTSIIETYIDNFKGNPLSTITASYYSKEVSINNYNISFQIWDTVGQEQYRSMNNLFFKDAQICLMVYDITREATFKSIKNYWHESVVNNGLEGVIFGIAGNKCDLYENENVDKDEVKEYCNEISAIFKFTSVKQNSNINELFMALGEKFVNSSFMLELGDEYFNQRNNSLNSFKIKKNDDNNDNKKKKKICC